MSAWSHLPNAVHIGRVLESIKSHPEVWNSARDAAYGASWYAARYAAYDAARYAARYAAYDAARYAARDAARDAVYTLNTASAGRWRGARDVAWGSILALIAYDDAAKYLDMPSDQLKTWEILSEDPSAVLLLPAVIAYEKISELETV